MPSSLIERRSARCRTCGAWWTLDPAVETEPCQCGGEIVPLTPQQLQAHRATMPYVPFDHAKDAKSKETPK